MRFIAMMVLICAIALVLGMLLGYSYEINQIIP